MPYDEVMSKFSKGKLRSGGSGKKVTNPKQAVAIMYSEKRSSKPEYHGKGPGGASRGMQGVFGAVKPTKKSGAQKAAVKQSSPTFPSKGSKNVRGILGR